MRPLLRLVSFERKAGEAVIKKAFPILRFKRDIRLYPQCPSLIPWNVVERCRERIELEYGPLEALASRRYSDLLVGLDPLELERVLSGREFGFDGTYTSAYASAVLHLQQLSGSR